MYSPNQNSNSLDRLFDFLCEAICKFETCGTGNISVDIQRYSGIGGEDKLKINVQNLIDAPFLFSKEEFKNYLQQSPIFKTQANLIFRNDLMKILQKTGFGSIDISFSKDRKKFLVSRVTLSHRYVLE